MDSTMTTVLEVIIKAQDEASKQLKDLANTVDGTAGHFGGLRTALAGLGAGAAIGLAGAIKAAADFQNQLVIAQNNTTMTAKDMAVMRAAVLQLAGESNAPIAQLIDGFRHIANFGFSAKDSVQILQAAMESAVSTNANTADVANALGNAMHEFGIRATDAGKAMNVLHLAAAQGNMTLEQFVDGAGKALGMAANLHVPLDQVSAALSALTRHGESVSVASTNIAGMLSKIVNPSKAAETELANLSRRSGVDLVYDFSAAGLASKGLTGVLSDLMKATGGNTSEIFKLIPAMRGGQAAMILTGTGAKDFHSILTSLTDTMAGRTDPTLDAFHRAMQQPAALLGRLANQVQIAAIAVGSALLPMLGRLLGAIMPVAQAITHWVEAHAQLSAAILAGVAVVGLLAGGLGALNLAFFALSPAIGLVVPILTAMAGPLLVVGAAVAALALAWRANWGGIQEKTLEAWHAIQPVYRDIEYAGSTIEYAFRKLQAAFQSGGLAGAFKELPAALAPVKGALAMLGAQILHAFESINWSAVLATIVQHAQTWGAALVSWVAPRIPPLLAEAGKLLGQLGGWLKGTALPEIVAHLAAWGSALIGWIGPRIGPMLAALGGLLGQLLSRIGEATVPLRAQLGKWASEFAAWVGPAVTQFLKNWPQILDSLLNNVDKALPGILAQLGRWGDAFARWIGPALPGMIKALALIPVAIFVFISETALVLLKHLAIWGLQLAGWVAPAIPHALAAIGHLLDELVAWLHSSGVPALKTGAQTLGEAILHGLAAGASSLLSWLTSQLSALWQHILSSIKSFFGINSPSTVFVQIGENLIEGLIGGIQGMASQLLGDVTGLFGRVLSAAKDLPGHLLDAGKNVAAGLANGIKHGAGAVADGAKKMAGDTLGAVTHFLGINSPSTVFHEVGVNIVLGAVQGVLAEGPALVAAVRKVIEQAVAAGRQAAAAGAITLTLGAGVGAAQAASLSGVGVGGGSLASSLPAAIGGFDKAGQLAAAAAQHAKNLADIQSRTVTTAADYWDKQKAATDEAARYAAQKKEIEAAAAQAALRDQAAYRQALADAARAEIAGLSGVAAAKAKTHADDLQHVATLAAIKAADYGNDHAYWTQRAAADAAYMKQQAADQRAVAQAQADAHKAHLAQIAEAAAKRKAAHDEAIKAALDGQAQVKKAVADAYDQETQWETGLAALKAKAHSDDLHYQADLAALTAKDYNDTRKYYSDLANLEADHARTAQHDLQTIQHAEAVLAAQKAAAVLAERAARTTQHNEYAAQIQAERAARAQQHADAMAQAAEARAQRAANHAEAMRQLAEERQQRALAHSEELTALHNATQAAHDMATAAKTIASGAAVAGYGSTGNPSVDSATILQNMAALLGGGAGGPSLPGTLAGDQKQLQDTLKNASDALPGIVQQLAKATDLQQLQTTYDQQHNQYLQLETAAREANNRDLLAQLQGQDRGLTQAYQADKLLQSQQDHAYALYQTAQKTLGTEQQKLQTLQDQAQSARDALQTAQQNLADTQLTVGQRQQLSALTVPYDAQHLQQTIALQQLTDQYHQQNLALTEQIQTARNNGNTSALKGLQDQQQALSDNYQQQQQALQDQMQSATDIYDAQRQQISDLQQQTNDAIQLQKAQQAVATAQDKVDKANAAVSAAQTQVQQDTQAANNAKTVWQNAINTKAQADFNAYQNARLNQASLNAFIKQSYADQTNLANQLQTTYNQNHATQMANIAAENAARGIATPGAASTTAAAASAASAATTGSVQAGASVAAAMAIADQIAQSAGGSAAVAQMQQNAAELGELIAAGLARGLTNTQAAQQAIYTLNLMLAGQLEAHWQLSSPSRRTYQYGLMIAQGLADGIRAGTPGVRSAIMGLYDEANPGYRPPLSSAGTAGSGAASPVQITITVQSGAVQVTGKADAGVAEAIAAALGSFVQDMIASQRTTAPGARRLLPGALTPLPAGS